MRAQLSMLAGWGNYPAQVGTVYRPHKKDGCARVLALAEENGASCIARGLGRSYGDSALNEGGVVIDQTARNRLLAFDERTGLLECEAGVTFRDIVATFLPRGWFPPVTPGTKNITVGGAIACDVHGKNHHRDGTFGRHVAKLTLMLADGSVAECSPQLRPELFRATVGGIGLTGVILSAAFRLVPVESAYIRADYRKAAGLDEALELFDTTDDDYQYSVAWIDCLASGRQLGRSVLMRGNHAPAAGLPREAAASPLAVRGGTRLTVPFRLPSGLLNPVTIGAFNKLYDAAHRDRTSKLVGCDAYFYPLDAIGGWNRLYGRRGFVQYQFALPEATSREGLADILQRLSGSRRSSFLAVLKRFGPQGDGYLSFPFKGYTLALDLPYTDDLVPFLHGLDERVLHYGGRIYLAKDAVMRRETFEAMYPDLDAFRRVRQAVDPDERWSSSQARRLGLAGGAR